MAVFKCKMCGGSLEVREGMTVCECEYCGSEQTIPTNTDENIRGLFNRANVLRLKSEFDKAEEVYEKILQISSSEAEAYWGLILCKYGVEYVEDPKTLKRVPTCHRTSYDVITADEDYKNAVYYADMSQKSLYEAEAKTIDEIQKGILAISRQEEPYDVFICYKETDENGKRTQDSVIANDIYYQLTQQGFKVFYAAITLEDKLGSEYEPYIFSALNTAKVMLALGTKPEYFNAVWVKNEWSRFLKIMKKDRSKLLIPCYRDMDAYELPEEFAHLQAQDMSKIGFINDVVRGIQKVIVREDSQTAEKETAAAREGNSAGTTPLLKRAGMFLEDGNWQRADEFCEQVLNIDPENAQAYVYKLMAELKVHTQPDLINCAEPFDTKNNYQKAMRFAAPALQDELSSCIAAIKERNEVSRKNNIYSMALSKMNIDADEEAYRKAAELFGRIPGWKDSDDRAKQALKKYEIAHRDNLYKNAMNTARKDDSASIEKAIAMLQQIPDWKDVPEKLESLAVRLEEAKTNEAEQEQKKQHRLALEKQYNQKYSAMIKEEKDCAVKLKATEKELEAALSTKTVGSSIAVGWGIFQSGLGLFCLPITVATALLNLAFGIIILSLGIVSKVNRGKRIAGLRNQQVALQSRMQELQSVPSLSQFIESQGE